MPTYQFLVESVYEEIVEIEAEDLSAAEMLLADGLGDQISIDKSQSYIVNHMEIDKEEDEWL